jgi:hypothetical protein
MYNGLRLPMFAGKKKILMFAGKKTILWKDRIFIFINKDRSTGKETDYCRHKYIRYCSQSESPSPAVWTLDSSLGSEPVYRIDKAATAHFRQQKHNLL